jgi:DMSO reductase family type II enzyme heme b subunit
MTRLARSRRLALAALVLFAAGVLQFTGINPAASQTVLLVAYESPSDPGLNPNDAAWDAVRAVEVPLSAQRGSYAAGGGSVGLVRLKALHHEGRLYVRAEWTDRTENASALRVQDFTDAVALEFPARTAATVPSVCMGQPDAGVNIWYWRADVDAGATSLQVANPNMHVDGYPFTDDTFLTARGAGNPVAADSPVQTLTSHLFGYLNTSPVQDATGHGVRTADGWAVVFSRDFKSDGPDHADFGPGARTDLAVAVWDGANQERDGMKSVSQFITFQVAAAEVPGHTGIDARFVLIAILLLVGVSGIGIGLAVYGASERGGRP